MKEIGEASRWYRRGRRWCTIFGIVSAVFLVFRTEASGLDTIYMAITPGKNFQHVIYPIAQEKGYMREEGIDLKLLIIGATPSLQGLIAGSIQFTVAGTSALMLIRLFQQDTTCSVLACHGRCFPEAWVNFSVSLPAKRLVRNIWQLVAGLTGLSVRSAGTSVRMS